MFGSSSSDPYVKVTVGEQTRQTGHIKNTQVSLSLSLSVSLSLSLSLSLC
eukprot:COSAG03_NODE_11894_length_571_cov_1.055085_2_plen_49_part_01